MSDYIYDVVVIVPMSSRDAANTLFRVWDSVGGDLSLGRVLLSASGSAPATHTACRTRMTQAILDILLANRTSLTGVIIKFTDEPNDWNTEIAAQGLQIIGGE